MSRKGTFLGAMALVVGCWLSFAGEVEGHQTDRAEHNTEVRADSGEVEQLLSLSPVDLAHHLGHIGHGESPPAEQLEAFRDEFGDYIDDHTGVKADGEVCELTEAEFVAFPAGDGRIHRHQLWECAVDPREVVVANRVMVDGHDGYRHIAQIQVGDDIYPTVFDGRHPTYAVYPGATDGEEDGDETPPDSPPSGEHETASEGAEEVDDEADAERSDDSGVGIASFAALFVVAVAAAIVIAWRRKKLDQSTRVDNGDAKS